MKPDTRNGNSDKNTRALIDPARLLRTAKSVYREVPGAEVLHIYAQFIPINTSNHSTEIRRFPPRRRRSAVR